jgi:hypothetical protein
MFATDLPLEQEAETVGARRERKTRERSIRSNSINTSRTSISSANCSANSASTDRELWWSSGLKKAKSIKPRILRPSTGQTANSQGTAKTVPTKLDLTCTHDFKDPALQPSWTYTSTLSATLPSGDPLHPQQDEVPELEGDISSRKTDSTRSRISRRSSTVSMF